jgi:hypothetical protein
MGFNTQSIPGGGNVRAWTGSILIQDCTLDNVTVEATHSMVVIERSEIVADHEQVTLYRCWGSLVDCKFRSAFGPLSYRRALEYPELPHLWSVSLWGYPDNFWGPDPTEPFQVTRCEFRDSIMGLDLAMTRVTLDDCTFINISQMALWDHETRGLGTREEITATNDFIECNDTIYFQTHDCNIEFYHRDRSFEDWPDYINTYGRVIGVDEGEVPDHDLIWTWTADADIYMPTTIVDGEGNVSRPQVITIGFEVDWAGTALENISTNRSSHLVDFTGRDDNGGNGGKGDENETIWPSLYPQDLTSTGPGSVLIDMVVSTSYWRSWSIPPPVRNLAVTVRMDGNLVTVLDIKEDMNPYGWNEVYLNATLDLPLGHHMVNLSLSAELNETGDRVYVNGWNLSMMRADNTTPVGDLVNGLEVYYNALFLDPGTEITITNESLPEGEGEIYWWWKVIQEEGSVLTFRDIPSERSDILYVNVDGPGGVIVEDLETGHLYLRKQFGWAEVSNVHVGQFDIRATVTEMLIENCTGSTSWWSGYGADLTVVDCDLNLSQTDSWSTTSTNLTFLGCDMIGNKSWFELRVGGGRMRFVDTTWVDIDVAFDVSDGPTGTLEVSGCHFVGDRGVLTIKGHTWWYSTYRSSNLSRVSITGNTFTGPNTGITAEAFMFGDEISDNILQDGAISIAWFNTSPIMVWDNGSTDVWSIWMYPRPFTEELVQFELFDWDDDEVMLVAVDVTNATGPPASPVLDLALYQRGGISWFTTIDLSDPSPTIVVPVWGDPLLNLLALLRGETDVNFWED